MGMPEIDSADGSSGQTGFSNLPKMKKPVKPDTQDLKKQTDMLTAEIERYAERIKVIKSTLDNRRGRSQMSAQEREATRTLQDSRAEHLKTLNLKQAVREELARVDEKRDSLRTQVKQVKGKGRALEDFDAQIKKIEHKINTEDLTPEEEEAAINQIKLLAKSREAVKSHNQHLNSIQGDDPLRAELIAKMKTLDEALDKLKGEGERSRAELQKIRAQQSEESEDFQTLVQEKQDCWEVMKALRDKRSQIKVEIDNVMENFRKENAAFRDHLAKERQMRDDQKRAEYQKNSAEREAKKKEYEAKKKEYEAFQKASKKDEDIAFCDQLLAYLKRFVEVKSEEPKAGEAELSAAEPGEGMRLLKKGDDELMGTWLFKANAQSKKSKGKKSKKPVEKPVEKRLNHPLDSLSAFHFLRIAVPNTVSEVGKAIEAVEQKKKDIQEGKVHEPSGSGSGSSSRNKPEKPEEAMAEDAEKENEKGAPDAGNEVEKVSPDSGKEAQKDDADVEKKNANDAENTDNSDAGDAGAADPVATPPGDDADVDKPKPVESEEKTAESEEKSAEPDAEEGFPPLGGDAHQEEADEQMPARDAEE